MLDFFFLGGGNRGNWGIQTHPAFPAILPHPNLYRTTFPTSLPHPHLNEYTPYFYHNHSYRIFHIHIPTNTSRTSTKTATASLTFLLHSPQQPSDSLYFYHIHIYRILRNPITSIATLLSLLYR